MQLERQPDAKGDRVKITLSGKFLPFSYYGAGDGVPPNGARTS
jgi:cyanate lyase